jgi:hypothetical protein
MRLANDLACRVRGRAICGQPDCLLTLCRVAGYRLCATAPLNIFQGRASGIQDGAGAW